MFGFFPNIHHGKFSYFLIFLHLTPSFMVVFLYFGSVWGEVIIFLKYLLFNMEKHIYKNSKLFQEATSSLKVLTKIVQNLLTLLTVISLLACLVFISSILQSLPTVSSFFTSFVFTSYLIFAQTSSGPTFLKNVSVSLQ